MNSLLLEMERQWVATAALIVLVLVARYLASRSVRASGLPAEVQRRWLVQVRTLAVLILVFGLAVIWAAELRTAAFSLVAVAVAFTIATKELILCLSGSLVRTSARAFALGDRIEVQSFRGDVIDIGALSTKVLEVDETTNRRTGRVITLPNSLFLSTPVINESFVVGYVLTVMSLPLSRDDDWAAAERDILDAAAEECATFLDDAKEKITRLSRQESLDAPIVEPTVSLALSEESIELVLRFPAPVRRSHRVEQRILRNYLSRRPATTRSLKTESTKGKREHEA